jgi:hypothetical protein
MSSAGTAPRITIAQHYVVAAMTICVMLMASLLWMPSMLGALSQGYGLEPRLLSYLAFSELGGFVVGTLFTSTKSIGQLKRWLLFGCTISIFANVTLMLFAPRVPFLLMRPLAGLGAGIGYGYGLKLCTLSVKPTRNFGYFTAAMSLVMIIGFQVIAYLVDSSGTGSGVPNADGARHASNIVFGIYATLAGFAGCILFIYHPPSAGAASKDIFGTRGRVEGPVLLCLLAIVLSFIGQGAIWAFLQVLGRSHGFSVVGVANAMSAFAIMGIVGSLSAAALPSRMPTWIPLGAALALLSSGLYALYAPASLLWYVWGCSIGGFYWNFALSIMLGLLARIDHTGMGSVLGGTLSSAGSAIGPLCAGLLIQGANYQPVGWLAGALCTGGFACVWLVEFAGRPNATKPGLKTL